VELNRGFWAKLEAWIRHLLSGPVEEMVVITGPVFAPQLVSGSWVLSHRTIGTFPRLIAVPSHFFKVIVVAERRR
jgi:endonuclease G